MMKRISKGEGIRLKESLSSKLSVNELKEVARRIGVEIPEEITAVLSKWEKRGEELVVNKEQYAPGEYEQKQEELFGESGIAIRFYKWVDYLTT